MMSIRRSLLRTAASAVSASRASAVSTATPLVRSVAAQSSIFQAAKSRTAMVSAAQAARYFSQTARVANSEEKPAAVEGEQTAAETATETATETAPAPKADAEENDEYSIFVRNLVFDATEEHLLQAFSDYGSVVKASIARDARGLSRGFGFVYYTNVEDRDRAIESANGNFWHGRRISVQTRTPRAPRTPVDNSRPLHEESNQLYLGNLPYETTDADLNDLFRDLPGVTGVRIAVDKSTGWSRGFAHVDFATIEEAKEAFNTLNGRQVRGRDLRLDYARPAQQYTERQQRQRGSNN